VNPWDQAYRAPSPPPWDIGRPQPVFERLVETGAITGRVIDVGCGTGENTLMAASHGLEAVGVDIASTAVDRARAKARQRGIAVAWFVWDVLELGRIADRIGHFDSAIDSGVFHTFSDADRRGYVASIASVVRTDGRLFLMCFSEHEPDWGGPRRVTREEIRDAFSHDRGWSVEEIDAARFATNPIEMPSDATDPKRGAHAWLARIRRLETPSPTGSR
jgi:cyclopropane fatty-acyl-phospholipid synthase-like methyltransferase